MRDEIPAFARMKMKLKVCGMKYKENLEAVANLLPDYLGFIFYKKSARHFDSSIPELPKSIKKVGVFVDEKLEIVQDTIKTFNLQAVQLHGHESPKYCAAINTLICFNPLKMSVIIIYSIPKENYQAETVTRSTGMY